MKHEIAPCLSGGFDVFAWNVKYDGSHGHKGKFGHFATHEAAEAAWNAPPDHRSPPVKP